MLNVITLEREDTKLADTTSVVGTEAGRPVKIVFWGRPHSDNKSCFAQSELPVIVDEVHNRKEFLASFAERTPDALVYQAAPLDPKNICELEDIIEQLGPVRPLIVTYSKNGVSWAPYLLRLAGSDCHFNDEPTFLEIREQIKSLSSQKSRG